MNTEEVVELLEKTLEIFDQRDSCVGTHFIGNKVCLNGALVLATGEPYEVRSLGVVPLRYVELHDRCYQISRVGNKKVNCANILEELPEYKEVDKILSDVLLNKVNHNSLWLYNDTCETHEERREILVDTIKYLRNQ